MTSRQLVCSLLQKAEKNRQFSNLALDHALSESGLSAPDRALAATLFYGVIERKLTLDYQLSHLSSRPLSQLDGTVLTALRMGLYQLMYLDRIPPHAVLYETVALCPKKSAGFVNAVLRAYTRSDGMLLPKREDGLAAYLSVAHSVGLPLCQKLIEAMGEQGAEDFLVGIGTPPPTTVRVNTLKTNRASLMRQLGETDSEAVPTPFSPHGLRIKGSVRELYGFEEGLFFVQDEASQLCVEALDPQPGQTVADICACPGSKSFGLAMKMENEGTLLSFDLHEKKLPLIRSGAERLGITCIRC
ncbi:MAG: 16S rRNA (cytosine(967)-C(5))-methyltransferase RsmB, partial [Clostridia bacterium]|nr:16S rRNA (cytosine(967)-C(5))-methyltransferase RsmB [Clostridia bacterium]